jgi:YafQ family addiction module toxin component
MFKFQISDKLKKIIETLNKRDRARSLIIAKKIQEIINNDSKSVQRYKNLRYNLSDYKRVHIDKSFVLIFRIFEEENFILFERLDHHDNIYKS